MRAEFEFVPLDGRATLIPTVRVRLWGAREHVARGAPFGAEVLAVYRDLVAAAKRALPAAMPGLCVDLFPAEAALFERTAGRDEVRLRLRAFSADAGLVRTWARAVWTALRDAGAKVEPSVWPRP